MIFFSSSKWQLFLPNQRDRLQLIHLQLIKISLPQRYIVLNISKSKKSVTEFDPCLFLINSQPVPSITTNNPTIHALPTVSSVIPNAKSFKATPEFLTSKATHPTQPILSDSSPSNHLTPPLSLPSSHPQSDHLPAALPPPPTTNPPLPSTLPPPPATHPLLPSTLPPPPSNHPPPVTHPLLPSTLPPPPATYPPLRSNTPPPLPTNHPPPLPIAPYPAPVAEDSFESLPVAEFEDNDEDDEEYSNIPPSVPPLPVFPPSEPLDFDMGFVATGNSVLSFAPTELPSFNSFSAPMGTAFDAFDSSAFDDVSPIIAPPFRPVEGFPEDGMSVAESDPFSPAIVTAAIDPFAPVEQQFVFPPSSTQLSSDPFLSKPPQDFIEFQGFPNESEIDKKELVFSIPSTSITVPEFAPIIHGLPQPNKPESSFPLVDPPSESPPAIAKEEEDPFLDFSGFHLKPAAPVVVAAAAAAVSKPNQKHAAEDKKPPPLAPKAGDPFETLLPQIKSHAPSSSTAKSSVSSTAVSNERLNSIPLNLIMQRQPLGAVGLPTALQADQSKLQPLTESFTGFTGFTPALATSLPFAAAPTQSFNFDAPVASLSFGAPSLVGGFDAFSSSSDESFADQNSSVPTDDFSFSAITSSATAVSHTFDFDVPPPSAVNDPFDLTFIQPTKIVTAATILPSLSSVPPITQPAMTTSALDIFGSSNTVIIAPSKAVKPAPVALPAFQDDFDVFAHPSSSAMSASHAPSNKVPADDFDIFAHTTTTAPKPAANSFTDDFDIFSHPTGPATVAAPVTSLQLLQQQQSMAFDDFDGGHNDDPFAHATDDPFAAVSSDPFAAAASYTPSTARKKLREMYNIQAEDDLEDEDDDDDEEDEGRERRPNPNVDNRLKSADGKGPPAMGMILLVAAVTCNMKLLITT